MNKRHLPFWFFVISCFFLLIIRDLFRDGMFMDGMIYTSVAKNLANGLGTFWHPHFSKTLMQSYHEQPPLLFGIEALFFMLFGNSMYVERFYGLLIVLTTLFLIIRLWKDVFYDQQEKNISWLPVLFWLSIPVCFWSYSNNMEEPTMGMFSLGAVLFIRKALIHRGKSYLYLGIASFLLIASSMCKGVQGLFPLAAVFFYWILFRNFSFSKMLAYSAFLFILIVVFYVLISFNENTRSSYEMYFNNRIVTTFVNPASTHTDRFYIFKQLFSELIPVFILLFIGGISIRFRKVYSVINKSHIKIACWFFLIGLSGTLPLLLTIEQSGYYLVTVMPYYAIGFAVLYAPSVSILVEQIKTNSKKYKMGTIVISIFFAASILFSVITIASGPKRDTEVLHDVHLTGAIITHAGIVSIPKEMWDNWSLHAYYNRYFYISLDPSTKQHKFFLLDKTLSIQLVPEGYQILNLPTQKYNLYIHNSYLKKPE